VEDGGAGPDAVEFLCEGDVFEGLAEGGLAGDLGGDFAEFFGAVDGEDTVAVAEEVFAVAAGTAAEVQNGCVRGQVREEEGIERTDVSV